MNSNDAQKSTQQPKQDGNNQVKPQVEHFQAHPGPAIPKNFDAPMEGTKEERMKKMEQMNKK